MEGKFYTQLWLIVCMCILMPPFGLALCIGFKNPKTKTRRIILIVLTLINWAVWLYIQRVLGIN